MSNMRSLDYKMGKLIVMIKNIFRVSITCYLAKEFSHTILFAVYIPPSEPKSLQCPLALSKLDHCLVQLFLQYTHLFLTK